MVSQPTLLKGFTPALLPITPVILVLSGPFSPSATSTPGHILVDATWASPNMTTAMAPPLAIIDWEFATAKGGRGVNGDMAQLALIGTALAGHEAVVRLLLDRGADVDAKAENEVTALIGAALAGHEAVVRLLLDRRADWMRRPKMGRRR